MATILLSDKDSDDQVVAVINTKTTTREELQDKIDMIKFDWSNENNPDYLINTIINALPKDCKLIAYPDKVYY